MMENISINQLSKELSIYGNKGNVWGNTAHAYKSNNGNLCGTPALATNWARIEGVTEVGCPKCLEILNSSNPNVI